MICLGLGVRLEARVIQCFPLVTGVEIHTHGGASHNNSPPKRRVELELILRQGLGLKLH